MKKVLIFYFLLVGNMSFTQVSASEDSFLDARGESNQVQIMDAVFKVCDVNFGMSGFDSKVECKNSKCKNVFEIFGHDYDVDVLITPEYKFILTDSLDDKPGIEEISPTVNNVFQDIEGIELSTSINELSKDDAKSMADCVKKLGPLFVEKFLEIGQKELTENELKISPSNELNLVERKITLEGLEYATAKIYYPLSLNEKEGGLIILTIIPSMRFATNPNKIDENELKRAAIELKNLMLLIGGDPLKFSTKFSTDEGVEISGDLSYKKVVWVGGEIVKISNSYTTLSASVEGLDFKIIKLSPNEQPLNPMIPTRWVWQVKPEDYTNSILYLSIESQAVSGKKHLYTNQISIEINKERSKIRMVFHFMRSNWEFLVGTLLIPLIIFVWKYKHRNSNDRSLTKGV